MTHNTLFGRQTNHWFHSAVQILILHTGIQALEKSDVHSVLNHERTANGIAQAIQDQEDSLNSPVKW